MFIATAMSHSAKLRRSGMCLLLRRVACTCRSYGAWAITNTVAINVMLLTELADGQRRSSHSL